MDLAPQLRRAADGVVVIEPAVLATFFAQRDGSTREVAAATR
jgi:hypothetical protein